jgi:hypothetical protein
MKYNHWRLSNKEKGGSCLTLTINPRIWGAYDSVDVEIDK